MNLGLEGLFEVLEVLGGEGLVEGRGSWKCGADGDGLRLVSHGLEDSNSWQLGGFGVLDLPVEGGIVRGASREGARNLG